MNYKHSFSYGLASLLNYDMAKNVSATGADYNNYSVVDTNTYNVILEQSDGNITLVREVYLSFISEAEVLVKRINDYHEKHNYQKLSETVHSLSGISAAVGANRLRQIVNDIENNIKLQDFELVDVLVYILEDAYMEFKRTVNNML